MYLVAIAWGFVVVLMALVEATSSQGTVLGAFFTLLLYGVLPLSIVLYVMGAPGRKQARRKLESEQTNAGGHAAPLQAEPLGAEGKEP